MAEMLKEYKEYFKSRIENGHIPQIDFDKISMWLYELDNEVSKLKEEKEMKFLKRRNR